MTQITLPKQNQTGANEWADVQDNDEAIVSVVNGNLDNNNIAANAAISYSKLASIPTGSILLGNGGTPTATALGGDATISSTGSLSISSVTGANAIVTSNITNDAVTAAKLADATDAAIAATPPTAAETDRAVTSDHIRSSAITTGKINDSAVTTAKIADGAVTGPKIASSAIYKNGIYSTTSTTIGSSATLLAQFSSVPPGVYTVTGDLTISTTGNAGEITVSLWAGTAFVTSPYQGTFTGGTNTGGYSIVSTVMDPGPDINTKVSYSVTGILTVVATTNVYLYATDPAAETTRLSSGMTCFGIKS